MFAMSATSATSATPAMSAAPLTCLPIRVRRLGRVEYRDAWQSMIDFTAARVPQTPDELWLCEHPPVYTLGRAGKPEHRLSDNGIEMIRVDRGGQITYHGPGQAVIYLLIDLNRRGLGVRDFVSRIEQAMIDLLGEYGIHAGRRQGAPGVYLNTENGPEKIASLGLRIRHGCSYHGLSLNVDMDLTPFTAINPCGYEGLKMTRMADHADPCPTWSEVAERLAAHLQRELMAEQTV